MVTRFPFRRTRSHSSPARITPSPPGTARAGATGSSSEMSPASLPGPPRRCRVHQWEVTMADPADGSTRSKVDEATMPATDRRGRRRVGAAVLVLLAAATDGSGAMSNPTDRRGYPHDAGRRTGKCIANDHRPHRVDRDYNIPRRLDPGSSTTSPSAQNFQSGGPKAQSHVGRTVREAGLDRSTATPRGCWWRSRSRPYSNGGPKQPALAPGDVDKADDGFKVSSVGFVAL